MKSFYDILEIPKDAAPGDIKRAYFAMVKKFPPERFPEEFKAVRAAYEALSDAEKRAEHDRRGDLPGPAAQALKMSDECGRLGRHKQAAEILRSALKTYPGLPPLKAALARSLEKDGKNGTAAKIWEELCDQEPGSAEFIHELALSYAQRGWHKKAAARYEKAVSVSPHDPQLWEDYATLHASNEQWREASAICSRGLAALQEKGAGSVLLYAHKSAIASKYDPGSANQYLLGMKRAIKENPSDAKNTEAVELALAGVMSAKNYGSVHEILEMAGMLPRVGDELKLLLDIARTIADIEAIEENGFNQLFHDMLGAAFNECECDDCESQMLIMECHMLQDLHIFRPQINRLKKERPHLYALHADFFDEASMTREPDKLISRRVKAIGKLSPQGRPPGDDAPFPENQTVRRETPKTGRNDPCPCGSGKKYKRCCGAGS